VFIVAYNCLSLVICVDHCLSTFTCAYCCLSFGIPAPSVGDFLGKTAFRSKHTSQLYLWIVMIDWLQYSLLNFLSRALSNHSCIAYCIVLSLFTCVYHCLSSFTRVLNNTLFKIETWLNRGTYWTMLRIETWLNRGTYWTMLRIETWLNRGIHWTMFKIETWLNRGIYWTVFKIETWLNRGTHWTMFKIETWLNRGTYWTMFKHG